MIYSNKSFRCKRKLDHVFVKGSHYNGYEISSKLIIGRSIIAIKRIPYYETSYTNWDLILTLNEFAHCQMTLVCKYHFQFSNITNKFEMHNLASEYSENVMLVSMDYPICNSFLHQLVYFFASFKSQNGLVI